MGAKQAMNIAIMMSCTASIILSVTYFTDPLTMMTVIGVMLVITIFCLNDTCRKKSGTERHDRGGISEIMLLSEEDTEVSVWDIWGKTSVIFGLSDRRNRVDVDLSGTTYAGTVDQEHAVMNFYNGDWFLEDLGSKNGVYIQKERDEGKNRLSNVPCKVDKNDMIYLGITKLKVR